MKKPHRLTWAVGCGLGADKHYGAGSEVSELTIAQISIISEENTPHEKRQVLYVPLRRTGDLEQVSSFTYP